MVEATERLPVISQEIKSVSSDAIIRHDIVLKNDFLRFSIEGLIILSITFNTNTFRNLNSLVKKV